jgi:hypothetical protein
MRTAKVGHCAFGANVVVDEECYTGTCNANDFCDFTALPQPTPGRKRRRLTSFSCPVGKTLCPVGGFGREAGQLSLSGYEVR